MDRNFRARKVFGEHAIFELGTLYVGLDDVQSTQMLGKHKYEKRTVNYVANEGQTINTESPKFSLCWSCINVSTNAFFSVIVI